MRTDDTSNSLRWRTEPLTPQEAAQQEIGWWDYVMDAAGFFALGHVLPVEAALLLCCHNPHDCTEEKAEVVTCEPNTPDQITPDDFKRLRRTFIDLDHTKPGNRSLVDWMRAAVEAGRRVHPWAYEYAKHCGLWPSTEPTPVGHPLNEAPEPAPAEPTPTIMKKKALIAQLEHEWPSIEADLKEATRNGLKDAAAAGVHGEWRIEPARAWAQRKGKLKQAAPAHPLANVWRNRP